LKFLGHDPKLEMSESGISKYNNGNTVISANQFQANKIFGETNQERKISLGKCMLELWR
jgi:hypothetical protein